ncbi:MAG: AAA family ATPase [Chloroflexaceae bacterium]
MAKQTRSTRSKVPPEQLHDFLCDPHSYPHQPAQARLIQTHTSYVVIVSPYVYKIKKPVNFGFLDFSTLEQRHYYAEREVELNRRLCADTYLEVVPIMRKGHRLTFAGDGQVVEYAVKMRELSEPDFMKARLARGAVDDEDLLRIVAKLQTFYAQQPATPEIAECGRIENLRQITDENFQQMEPDIGQTLSWSAFETIRFYTNSFYAQHAALFEQRRQTGRIKDGHGDLHLEHIHLAPDAVCIYDCIEFNDQYRCVDVAYDTAFLAMDLDYNDRHDLARRFVRHMAAALDDPGMLRLMDFYKCVRACVRGKVETFRSNQPEVDAETRQQSRERARRYFRLALQYAVAGSAPTVLIVMGNVATGKSTLAEGLAAELGWEVYSSDRVRKELADLPLHRRSGPQERARLYAPEAKAEIYEQLMQRAAEHMQAGQSLILDATFSRRRQRDQVRRRIEQAGGVWSVIEARAATATMQERLAARATGADAVSDARLEDFDTIAHAYQPPYEIGLRQLLPVQTEGPPAGTISAILNDLAARQVRQG